VSNVEEITPALWSTLTGTTFHSNALAWADLPDGRSFLASGSDNGYSHLWDIVSGEPAQLFAQHGDWVLSIACAALPSGQPVVATGGKDRVVRIWEANTGRELRRLDGHTGSVNAVAWAVLPDGRALLASGGDDATVRVWDPSTGRELHRLSVGLDHIHLVYSVAWAVLPDGQACLATIADDDDAGRAVHLWDGLTGTRLRTLTGPAAPPGPGNAGGWGCVSMTADRHGRPLAAANVGGAAHVWDAATGEPLYMAGGVRAEALAWVRTAAGDVLVLVAAEDCITVLDGGTGREVTAVDVKKNGYFKSFAVTSTRDGAVLLAAAWADDSPARIWRLAVTSR
jgi:WD40 repeat protein